MLTRPSAVLGDVHFVKSQSRENERAEVVAQGTQAPQEEAHEPDGSGHRGYIQQEVTVLGKERCNRFSCHFLDSK